MWHSFEILCFWSDMYHHYRTWSLVQITHHLIKMTRRNVYVSTIFYTVAIHNMQKDILQKYHCVVAGQTLPGQLENAWQHTTKHTAKQRAVVPGKLSSCALILSKQNYPQRDPKYVFQSLCTHTTSQKRCESQGYSNPCKCALKDEEPELTLNKLPLGALPEL